VLTGWLLKLGFFGGDLSSPVFLGWFFVGGYAAPGGA
jgi:hypothetical protein